LHTFSRYLEKTREELKEMKRRNWPNLKKRRKQVMLWKCRWEKKEKDESKVTVIMLQPFFYEREDENNQVSLW